MVGSLSSTGVGNAWGSSHQIQVGRVDCSTKAGIVMCYMNQRCPEDVAAQVAESELQDYLPWSAFPNYRPMNKEARPRHVVSAPASWIGILGDFVDTD